jgi:hypothetical protein
MGFHPLLEVTEQRQIVGLVGINYIVTKVLLDNIGLPIKIIMMLGQLNLVMLLVFYGGI